MNCVKSISSMNISGLMRTEYCIIKHQRQPRVVIPAALVPTVLACYHELPSTAHQGVSRTMGFISWKYWWKTLRSGFRIY